MMPMEIAAERARADWIEFDCQLSAETTHHVNAARASIFTTTTDRCTLTVSTMSPTSAIAIRSLVEAAGQQ